MLAIVDDDNIRISMGERGRDLCYASLLRRLRESARAVSAHTVLTHPPGDERRKHHLQKCGWGVLAVPHELAHTVRGVEIKTNADMDLCFECAGLLRHGKYDAVLIGSGDGDLCVALARGLRRFSPARRIMTLSVQNHSSRRLFSRPDLFDANALIETDIACASEGN